MSSLSHVQFNLFLMYINTIHELRDRWKPSVLGSGRGCRNPPWNKNTFSILCLTATMSRPMPQNSKPKRSGVKQSSSSSGRVLVVSRSPAPQLSLKLEGKQKQKERSRSRAFASIIDSRTHVPGKSPFSISSGRLEKYIRQLVLGNEILEVTTLPSLAPQMVSTRTFRASIPIDSSNIVNGECHIYVPPSTAGSVFCTDIAASTQYPAAFGEDYRIRIHCSGDGKNTAKSIDGQAVFFNGEEKELNDGRKVRALKMDNQAASTYWLHLALGYAHYVTVWQSETGAKGSWTNATFNDKYMEAHTRAQGNFIQVSNWLYVEVRARFGKYGDTYANGPVEIYPVDLANSKTQFLAIASRTLYNKGVAFLEAQEVKRVRLTGMTALLTNTSAALEKKGIINTGLIPQDEGVPAIQDYTNMTSNKKYRGAAEHGGYVWWQANSEEALALQSLVVAHEVLEKQDAICFTLDGLDAESSFLLNVSWTVDFFSEKQIFNKAVTPIYTPEYKECLNYLAQCPHASCNPDHVKMFKEIMKHGVSAVQSLYDTYNENPALYNGLASLFLKAIA